MTLHPLGHGWTIVMCSVMNKKTTKTSDNEGGGDI